MSMCGFVLRVDMTVGQIDSQLPPHVFSAECEFVMVVVGHFLFVLCRVFPCFLSTAALANSTRVYHPNHQCFRKSVFLKRSSAGATLPLSPPHNHHHPHHPLRLFSHHLPLRVTLWVSMSHVEMKTGVQSPLSVFVASVAVTCASQTQHPAQFFCKVGGCSHVCHVTHSFGKKTFWSPIWFPTVGTAVHSLQK